MLSSSAIIFSVVMWVATFSSAIPQTDVANATTDSIVTDTLYQSSDSTGNSNLIGQLTELKRQNNLLHLRQQFTTGGLAMILIIGAMLVFIVLNSRWAHRLEIKNMQLRRERNLVVAQNNQLAIERDRAEAASKAKTAFMQSMTHEIRTPLNAISGFSQVIAMNDIELSDDERAELNKHIQNGTQQLTNILDDLIQIADLESQTDNPDTDTYYINSIISQAADVIRPRIPASVALHTDCLLPAGTTVTTNKTLLLTALSRLLNNAVKFTTEGSITLSLGYDDNHQYLFSVADTGPGIPPDKKEFIFERFTKLDSFVQGTGLGLPLSRMIAERLGGTLTLNTEYTGGARFDLTIPNYNNTQKNII